MRIVALSACVALSRLAFIAKRSFGAVVAAAWVGLALLAGGCSSLDVTYIREGVGTELSTPGMSAVTLVQDVYVGEICRQAGLPTITHPYGEQQIVVCDEGVLRPIDWALFVQAGMNDIDRRCDAYLAWLDNKRRWREPILKQINITAATTAAILGLTGVGTAPIAIVGTAFGFASDTFVNLSSRLITEIDHVVVQTVVLGHQQEYRVKVARVPIDNRPAAIYLLRNYLRICTPFSIEMSVSNTVTVFHRAGAAALVRTTPMLERAPEVARATVIRSATVAMPPPPRVEPIEDDVRKGSFETRLRSKQIERLQKAACYKPPDGTYGTFTAETRAHILKYLNDKNLKDKNFPDRITANDGITLRKAFRDGPKCE